MVLLNAEISFSFLFLSFIFVFASFLLTCIFLHLYHTRNEIEKRRNIIFSDIAKQMEMSNEIEAKKAEALLTYTTKQI